VRAALHARRDLPSDWRVDNVYRIDLVRAGAGPVGTLVTWTGSLARGGIACTLSATSHALHDGPPAYASNPGLVGEGAFTPLSGRGTGLSASLRASLGRHARAGGTWAVRGPAPARASVFLSLDV